MIYKKFIIENYKAIKKTEILVNKEIIPIIGINESGKTSILNGILAFDIYNDRMNNSEHIKVKNRYHIEKNENCVISAEVKIEDKTEFDEIGKEININMGDSIYSWLNEKFTSNSNITILRDYNAQNGSLLKTYSLADDIGEVSDTKRKKLINCLIGRLPSILYFDDFSDRVPSTIEFPLNYRENGALTKKNRNYEWQKIIEEIFSRTLQNTTLQQFMNFEDDHDKKGLLDDVKTLLNKEIISEWKKLKTKYTALGGEEAVNLVLMIDYKEDKNTFSFSIRDEESGDGRFFDVNLRSKGFQWFFNFIMKLTFNPKYNRKPQDAIFLLDEPGSYLHSTAQTELLIKLCEIAEKNTIIYCTHSQYLLDPDKINIASIKIADKEEGIIHLTSFGNSKVRKNRGAFSAIDDALQLKFGFSNICIKKCLITEGIIDYYFLKMFFNFEEIEIIPGHGCSDLKELISIAISCSDKFLVILDNDEAGRNANKKYLKHFKQTFEQNSYIYDFSDIIAIEDILSKQDKSKVMKLTNCNNVKSAITIIYFWDAEKKQKFKDELTNLTCQNIETLSKKINTHFK